MAWTEWLLVGGPADGKRFEVLSDEIRVRLAEGDIYYEYCRHDFMHSERMYRVGAVDVKDLEPHKVERMIYETGLRPFMVTDTTPNAK